MIRWSVITLCLCFSVTVTGPDRAENPLVPQTPAESGSSKGQSAYRPTQRTLRGKVRWFGEILGEHTSVKPDKDAPNPVVLQTAGGEVYPILKDERGRAFYQDKRLRDRAMELDVRSWPGIPYVQVLSVYSIKNGRRYVVDYWCDTCAISAYDMRPCLCCQDLFGPMRLREEPVK